MTVAMRVVLALLPLAVYGLVIGRWQTGGTPRVVSGPRDFGLLAFGLGGLIAFGPAGQLVVSLVFPHPGLAAWTAVASFVGLVAMVLAIPARSRLAIYCIEAAELSQTLEAVMTEVAGPTTRTLQGFEDESTRKGLVVEYGPWLRCAVVKAYGDQPEALARVVRECLIQKFQKRPASANRTSRVWFTLAGVLAMGLILLVGVLAIFLVLGWLGGFFGDF